MQILMISTSEIKISCIIDSEVGEQALQYVHDKFELSGVKYITS